eukprot:CAMPEP_0185731070 /NCGR_PEP_ID=MMETSP1171-20130828/11809_1 /TAXON_ID=374046 /ORGANISM="Helicotheca tamensis, Strain CCMP826" /LENGTH=318 /DNA_ID=CAMNT_0028400253 /DNA_START=236 /DNA_END=1192 /DNA_ORIENTATION=+
MTTTEYNNNNYKKSNHRRKPLGSFSLEMLGLEFDVFRKSTSSFLDRLSISNISAKGGDTNYVLFALHKDSGGVEMSALFHRFSICYLDGEDIFCDWIADNLCHGMKAFDKRNRPFTAHRLLEFSIILSKVLSLCATSRSRGPIQTFSDILSNPADLILSILHQPLLLHDLVSINLFIYPTLVTLDRKISLKATNDSDATWQFYFSTFLLLFVIGGMANVMASSMTKLEVSGTKSAAASALGYHLAAYPSKILWTYMGYEMNASMLLFGISTLAAAVTMVDKLAGFQGWNAGSFMAWVFGGLSGKAFGDYIRRYGLRWF